MKYTCLNVTAGMNLILLLHYHQNLPKVIARMNLRLTSLGKVVPGETYEQSDRFYTNKKINYNFAIILPGTTLPKLVRLIVGNIPYVIMKNILSKLQLVEPQCIIIPNSVGIPNLNNHYG